MKTSLHYGVKEKYLRYLGFFVLFILSVIFYKERICFIDTAFQFFKIVNFGKFNVELNRYAAYIVQIPLLTALKSGAGLKTLAMIFSASYIVLYFIVFLICLYPLKNKAAALAVLLVLVICTGETFFHITTETHLALVFSVLFYAWLVYNLKFKQSLLKYLLIASLIIILTIFSHPMSLFTIFFVLIYLISNNLHNKDLRIRLLYISAIIIIVSVCKMLFLKTPTYESQFLGNLTAGNIPGLIRYSKSLNFFVKNIFSLYILIVLMSMALFIFYFIRKNYMKFFSLGIFNLLFFILTLLLYSKGDSHVMLERAYMPFAFFIALPFMVDFVPVLKKEYILIVIILILGKSFYTITKQGIHQKERTVYIQGMLDCNKKQGIYKSIAKKNTFNEGKIYVPWALPFETLILSSMNGETRTIITEQDWIHNNKDIGQTENIFLGADFWQTWNTNEFNKKYFSLPEENYRVVDYSGCE